MMENHIPLHSCLRSIIVTLAAFSLLSGCHKAGPAESATATAGAKDETAAPRTADRPDQKVGAADDEGHKGLHLKPEEVQKLGVTTAAVQATAHAPEASGFGVVIAHEVLAQALADLRTAAAVARQSQAALARGRRLAGTPGAMPLDSVEAAERQSTVDQAALTLARQRLSSTFGQETPWNGKDDSPILDSLASGAAKLVRVTFPMSALADTAPAAIRIGRIGVGQTAKTWNSSTVWAAPADTAVPGRSFFTILKGNSLGEGERLLAWTPVGKSNDGVVIPAAAALISGGRYWCYVETQPGTFMRIEFDADIPVSGGYFVTGGVNAGDKVVVKAAGQLLAKELSPSSEAE